MFIAFRHFHLLECFFSMRNSKNAGKSATDDRDCPVTIYLGVSFHQRAKQLLYYI